MKSYPLTPELRRRVVQALGETNALMEKEMRYSPDLRKPEYLARMDNHAKFLQNMLDTGIFVSKFG